MSKQTIIAKHRNERIAIMMGLVRLCFLGRNGKQRLSLLSLTSGWKCHEDRGDGLLAMFSKMAGKLSTSQTLGAYLRVGGFFREKPRWEPSHFATLFSCITLD